MSNIQKHENKSSAQLLHNMTELERQVCNAIHEYNQLRAIPLAPIEILEWKDTLLRLYPAIDVEALNFAILQMKADNIEYDQFFGIQNITKALKRVEKTKNGYKVKSNFRW